MTRGRVVAVVIASLAIGATSGLSVVGCGRSLGDEAASKDAASDPPVDASNPVADASDGGDSAPVACAAETRFRKITAVDVNPGVRIRSFARLLPDERTMFYAAGDSDDGRDLWVTTRSDSTKPFPTDAGTRLALSDAVVAEDDPSPVPDGLALAYLRAPKLADGGIRSTVRVAWRARIDDPFGTPVDVDFGVDPVSPNFTLDGAELWFSQAGVLKVAARQGQTFGEPFAPLIAGAPEGNRTAPVLSADKLTMFFAAGAPLRVYVTHRSSVLGPWDGAVLVAELPEVAATFPTWLSPDGCRLYLTVSDGTNATLHVADRSPR